MREGNVRSKKSRKFFKEISQIFARQVYAAGRPNRDDTAPNCFKPKIAILECFRERARAYSAVLAKPYYTSCFFTYILKN